MALGKDNLDKMRALAETYGACVRAGLITPCLQDENEFREMLGLKPAPAEVVADWLASDGVRRPITLARPQDTTEEGQAIPEQQPDQEATDANPNE